MKNVLLLLFLLLPLISSAQNLVRNPSFESFIQCPDSEFPTPNFNGYVRDWYSRDENNNEGPGKLERKACYKDFVLDSLYWYISTGKIPPQDGECMINAPWYSLTDLKKKRFYYFSELSAPLVKDQVYRVRYYVHFNKYYSITDHVGLIFMQDTNQLYKDGNSYLTNDYIGVRDSFLGPDDQWHLIQGCYTAKGGEAWLMLGNFLKDEEIHDHPFHKGMFSVAGPTLMIDHISVVPVSAAAIPDEQYAICDGEYFKFPSDPSGGYEVKDVTGKVVQGVSLSWPEKAVFYTWDACFGKKNTIEVVSKICSEELVLTRSICKHEALDIEALMPALFSVKDNTGQAIVDFKSSTTGTFTYPVTHARYGTFGSLTIQVSDCEDCKVHFPKVFSPKALQAENQRWGPFTNCALEKYSLRIFNRWGMVVYESEDPQASWNGYVGCQLAQDGVYVYTVTYQFNVPGKAGSMIQSQGDLLLTY